MENKKVHQPLRFLFVGKFFNTKGGNEIVDVFYKIYHETNHQFELTLVSLGDMNNHVFREFQDEQEYLQSAKEKVKGCPSIQWLTYVENDELLQMMKEFDVGILPSWGDTFGYSILEMQAVGCPVITSNVRAFDEINSEETGWMIRLPLSKHKEVTINNLEEKQKYRKLMQKQLEAIVLDILDRPEQIKQKSLAAYDQVNIQHSLDQYYQKLDQIYKEAFL